MAKPTRIHLIPVPRPTWKDKACVEKSLAALAAMGFEAVDTFTAPEIPDLQIVYLFNASDRSVGTVYESQSEGIWIDFVTYYDDGPAFNYTTAPGSLILPSPAWVQRSFRNARVKRMYRKFLANRPTGAMVVLTRDEIVHRAEEEYAAQHGG